jgi:ketosteroid isomerase-like protein
MNQPVVARFLDNIHRTFREEDPDVLIKHREEDHVRLIEKLFRHIAQGNLTGVNELLADDVEFELAGACDSPFIKNARGREAVLQALQHNFGQLDNQQPELLAIVAQGNMVMILGREQGKIRSTGRTYDLHWTHWFTLRDGKVRRLFEMFDSEPLRQAMQPG